MTKRAEFDPAQALLDRESALGDVTFIHLDERGWAYPECRRPIWWNNQLLGRCEAKGMWGVKLPAGDRIYCTGHAHATLVYVDAFAEAEKYAAQREAKLAQENAPKFSDN